MTNELFTPSKAYKPFRFPWAYEAWLEHEQMHWLFGEVPLADDVRDWVQKLTENERNLVTQIFRLFTQSDVEVENAYLDLYMPKFKPTEIRMMLSGFAAREALHQASYSYLLDTIGMPETEYSAFLEYTEMADKHEYLKKFNMDTPHNTALSMAVFGAFTEGLQLFASFAMLLNFPRFGKMKGMSQIVTWSVRDESCMSEDTEVLTNVGWKLFKDLDRTELLAQFSGERNTITFAKPLHYTAKPYKGEMVHIHREKGAIDVLCTPDHDMVIWYENPETHKTRIEKRKAENFPRGSYYRMPTAGHVEMEGSGLTAYERFLIALQADGSLPDTARYNGEHCGCLPVHFFLKKDRKIDRLDAIISELGFDVSKISEPRKGGFIYRVKVPMQLLLTKNFDDWGIDLSTKSQKWCEEFIKEITEWDGHRVLDRGVETGRIHYSSIVEANSLFVQTIASLAGYRAKVSAAPDERKETYSTVYRVHINPNQEWTRLGSIQRDRVEYDGMVYCATMPEGTIITRRNGAVGFVGNCHVTAIVRLFHELMAEDRTINREELARDIISACHEIVTNEDAFIDLVFEMGPVEGLTADDVKQYIRFVSNMRMRQLGLPEQFDVPVNPLPWIDEMMNAVEHASFFEQRATEYSRAATTGTWSDVFSD